MYMRIANNTTSIAIIKALNCDKNVNLPLNLKSKIIGWTCIRYTLKELDANHFITVLTFLLLNLSCEKHISKNTDSKTIKGFV